MLHPDLHPDRAQARKGLERFVHDGRHVFRPAEDVDHVHRLFDVREAGAHRLSQQGLAGMPGIHGDHAEALQPEIPRHVEAGPRLVRGHAHHGNHAGPAQDVSQECIRIGLAHNPQTRRARPAGKRIRRRTSADKKSARLNRAQSRNEGQ